MNNQENFYSSDNNNIDLMQLFSFSQEELAFFVFSKRLKYKIIKIKKRNGGERTLHAPVYKLKKAQRIILQELLYKKYQNLLTVNVTGFIPKRSIKDNARFHVRKKYILKLDIKDFFPSITKDRIYGLFRKEFNLDHSCSAALAGLCCYNNQLPQGAPTSPMLANMIARFLDYRILGLIKKYNNTEDLDFQYSRYADDLTFSFNKKIHINKFLNYIIDLLLEEGFFLNYKKINLISAGKQQKVTGVIVNSKISVGRKYYKKYKSIFYNISQNGFMQEMIKRNRVNEKTITSVDTFKEVLGGHLAFIKELSPNYYDELIKFNIQLN